MTAKHKIVGHWLSHVEAEKVVLELEKQGFDMQRLSLIGKDYRTTEEVGGFLTEKDTSLHIR